MNINLTIDFDFDAFEAEVYTAARVVFAKLQRDYSNETFYTFNFVTGDVMQDLHMLVNTEEELVRRVRREIQRNELYMHLPFENLKSYLRYHPSSFIQIDQDSDSAFSKFFAKSNDMLWALSSQIEKLEDELLEDEEADEEDYYDSVYETVDEPITARLMSVLRQLDAEGVFKITNERERIHLGLLQSQWDYDALPGPFHEINPPASCRRYAHYAEVFRAIAAALPD